MMDYAGGGSATGGQKETIAAIPQNRSLMVEKLTTDAPLTPEVVHGLQTVAQVFGHYRPAIECTFTDAEGRVVQETLRFNGLEDFSANAIARQSTVLQGLEDDEEGYLGILRQLQTNSGLQAALADPAARKALLEQVRQLMADLTNHQ